MKVLNEKEISLVSGGNGGTDLLANPNPHNAYTILKKFAEGYEASPNAIGKVIERVCVARYLLNRGGDRFRTQTIETLSRQIFDIASQDYDRYLCNELFGSH